MSGLLYDLFCGQSESRNPKEFCFFIFVHRLRIMVIPSIVYFKPIFLAQMPINHFTHFIMSPYQFVCKSWSCAAMIINSVPFFSSPLFSHFQLSVPRISFVPFKNCPCNFFPHHLSCLSFFFCSLYILGVSSFSFFIMLSSLTTLRNILLLSFKTNNIVSSHRSLHNL